MRERLVYFKSLLVGREEDDPGKRLAKIHFLRTTESAAAITHTLRPIMLLMLRISALCPVGGSCSRCKSSVDIKK